MTGRSGTLAAVALILATAASAVAVVAAVRAARDDHRRPAPRSAADPAGRRDLLGDLAVRLIPTTAGGFVVATPADRGDLADWVLAAALDARGSAPSRDRALRAVAHRLEGHDEPGGDGSQGTEGSAAAGLEGDDTRSAALAAAQALGANGEPLTAEHERLAEQILRRTRAELDAGNGSWLGPLLQLASGPSRAAAGAGELVSAYAGHPTCESLSRAGGGPVQPQRELTVLLVALVAQGETCPGAGALLDRLLQDPAWRAPIAGSELLDLARLAPRPTGGTVRRFQRSITGWLHPTDGSVVDAGTVLLAGRSSRLLGVRIDVPVAVRRHLTGQARLRGALADRSTAPPTAYDVVTLRQLAAQGLVSRSELSATVRAAEPLDDSSDAAVVDDLLIRGELPSCAEAAKARPKGPKVTLPWLIASEVQQVVRKECEGELDLPALIDGVRRRSRNYEEAPRILAVVLTACHLRPASLTNASAGLPEGGGPFADESFTLMGAAAGLDPVGTCAAELAA